MITILDSIINMTGRDIYDQFSHTINLHFDNEQDIMWAPQTMRQMATDKIWSWQWSQTHCVFWQPMRCGWGAWSGHVTPAHSEFSSILFFPYVASRAYTWGSGPNNPYIHPLKARVSADLGERTHTLAPRWMPNPLPPRSKCTGCFALAGLGIQQGTSVWVGSPKLHSHSHSSRLVPPPARGCIEAHLGLLEGQRGHTCIGRPSHECNDLWLHLTATPALLCHRCAGGRGRLGLPYDHDFGSWQPP